MEGAHRGSVGRESVVDERPCDDDAHDRYPDEAGDAGDGVVDRGRDPGVALVRVGEDGGDERGDREREPEGEYEECRQEFGDVVGVQPGAEQQQDADDATSGPAPMKSLGPRRSASPPKRRERANMTRVTGTIVRPLSSAV